MRSRTATAASPAMRHYLVMTALVVVYAVMLHWVYRVQIAPAFHYLGFRYRDPDPIGYALGITLTTALGFLMPWKVRRPSQFVLWVLYIMVAAPTMLVPHYAEILSVGKSLELTVVAAAAFGILIVGVWGRPWTIRLQVPPQLVWFAVFGISCMTYGYMFLTTGLSFQFVALGDVQSLRFAYRDDVASSGALLGYLIQLQGNVVNPILVARGIYSKRWTLVGAGAVGQMLIFSATGYKLTLLSVPAFIGLALAYRWKGRMGGGMLLGGVMIAAGAALAVDWLQGSLYYAQIFINRLLLIPGALSAAHVQVFEGHPKAMWGHSFLAGYVDYPYNVTPSFLVGQIFSGDPETSANANFIADGYANLGYTGVFIEAVALVIILRMLDATGRHLPIAATSIILLVPTLATVNSGAFTSLLTGGYLAAMVFMAILPRTEWSRRRRPPSRSSATSARAHPVSAQP